MNCDTVSLQKPRVGAAGDYLGNGGAKLVIFAGFSCFPRFILGELPKMKRGNFWKSTI
ncbi:MAG: hypothetical protein IJU62_02320 [Muribaculaceae bacterium]|nr:hypothetical protein [Muribaculaceae bacterium]